MKYSGSNLLKNEHLLYIGNFHWYIYIPGIFLYLFAIAIFMVNDYIWFMFGVYIIGLAILFLLLSIIVNITKELNVTSTRVIFKTGLINRNTVELNHDKIKSLNVDQGLVGHILGYGTLVFNGTGGEKIEISGICKPLEFRKYTKETIDLSKA